MDYILAFLDGIITFISPCLLPMLPVFLLYFAGDSGRVLQNRGRPHSGRPSEPQNGEGATARTARNVGGFVCGFALVFMALGAFAGTLGRLIVRYQVALNLICGAVIILMGLGFVGLIRLPGRQRQNTVRVGGFFSALAFGAVFSVSWTPCLSATLGAALMLAAQRATAGHGVLMLLCFSLGLGLPFMLCALFMAQLKGVLDFLRQRLGLISKISGGLLIWLGLLMATGLMGRWMALLS